MSVYRVTEVIRTSTESWEAAARNAVETAASTVRELRVAEIVRQDVTIEERPGRRLSNPTGRFRSSTNRRADRRARGPGISAPGLPLVKQATVGALLARPAGTASSTVETVADSTFPPGFFDRADPGVDSEFYTAPRLVTHIDDRAIAAVGALYAELGLTARSST